MAVIACLVVLVAPAVAPAFDYIVNEPGDPLRNQSCPTTCSLREAVDLAGNGDSINVPAGTYVLTQGELSLNGATLNGAGARLTIIDGNNNDRVVGVNSASGIAASINGVTIRNGFLAQTSPEGGGGINVDGGTLTVSNSHIIGNTAPSGGGINVGNGFDLTLTGSTVSGNTAQDDSADGGGIYAEAETDVTVTNSTISSNTVTATNLGFGRGGGIYANGYTLSLANVTLANNSASPGGGGVVPSVMTPTFTNSILADNAGGACVGGTVGGAGSHHNLVTDGSCVLTGPGNIQGVAAQLQALGNYGGPTDTRALASGSAAVNAGSGCAATDQRGIARPQGTACDIGAFEYVAPTLTVTTGVTNNDGGEDRPADFSVRVRDAAGADVSGSPQPGTTTGTTYTLAPGTFRVSASGSDLYSVALGGACSAAGDVSLSENQAVTCTVTANDRQPRAGREVGVIPVRGRVRFRVPGGKFRVLRESDLLPNGTTIDTLRGRVTLIAAANKRGRESKADFYDGVFKLRQSKGSRPTTTLTLTELLRCPKAGNASIAAKRKKKRRLWGDGSGKFRTKGKHSAATVVGTKWLVEDRCTSTLTRVVRGRVSVRDFEAKKTVVVRRGKSYIARAE